MSDYFPSMPVTLDNLDSLEYPPSWAYNYDKDHSDNIFSANQGDQSPAIYPDTSSSLQMSPDATAAPGGL